jgi:ribosomal protein S4E
MRFKIGDLVKVEYGYNTGNSGFICGIDSSKYGWPYTVQFWDETVHKYMSDKLVAVDKKVLFPF